MPTTPTPAVPSPQYPEQGIPAPDGRSVGAVVPGSTPQAVPLRTPYLGPVATRSMFPGTFNAGITQGMYRTWHQATDDIDALQIVEANWYSTGSAEEIVSGAPLTVQAEVVYGGIHAPLTFGAPIASGASGYSGFATIRIPRGAWFAIDRYRQCSAGLVTTNINPMDIYSAGRDVSNEGTSGIVNSVGSVAGPVQQGNPLTTSPPAAIFGMTRRATVGTIGDSRCRGAVTAVTTSTQNQYGDAGEVHRALREFGYINGGIYGSGIGAATGGNPRTVDLLSKCECIVIQRKINDVVTGASSAAVQGAITAIRNLFPGKKFIITTSAPAGSADNGTPAATNSVRVSLNAAIRGMSASDTAVADIASVVETGVGTGLWKPGLSSDYTHAVEAGYAAIEVAPLWDAVRSFIQLR